MVAAPTQPAEWVALYTYPSSAALYSQLPISEAALAPISARAAGIPRTSRYARALVSAIAGRCGGREAGCHHHRDPDPQFCGRTVNSPFQRLLARQGTSAPAETGERSSQHDLLTT